MILIAGPYRGGTNDDPVLIRKLATVFGTRYNILLHINFSRSVTQFNALKENQKEQTIFGNTQPLYTA